MGRGPQSWIRCPQDIALGRFAPPRRGLRIRQERARSGLFFYDGAAHRLELLRRGAIARQIVKYLAGQKWFGGAAFVVFMTAVFSRTQWKYHYARAYRAVLMEAGHLCQTFASLLRGWVSLRFAPLPSTTL